MIRLCVVSVPNLLNRKYFEAQAKENRRITIEEFANLFGASKSLMTMWMNGQRTPGPKYKSIIIEMYGVEALQAFGEDPRLYFINQHWDRADESLQHALHEKMQEYVTKNDVQHGQVTTTRQGGVSPLSHPLPRPDGRGSFLYLLERPRLCKHKSIAEQKRPDTLPS